MFSIYICYHLVYFDFVLVYVFEWHEFRCNFFKLPEKSDFSLQVERVVQGKVYTVSVVVLCFHKVNGTISQSGANAVLPVVVEHKNALAAWRPGTLGTLCSPFTVFEASSSSLKNEATQPRGESGGWRYKLYRRLNRGTWLQHPGRSRGLRFDIYKLRLKSSVKILKSFWFYSLFLFSCPAFFSASYHPAHVFKFALCMPDPARPAQWTVNGTSFRCSEPKLVTDFQTTYDSSDSFDRHLHDSTGTL